MQIYDLLSNQDLAQYANLELNVVLSRLIVKFQNQF